MADTADDKPSAAKASAKTDYDDSIETMQKQIGQIAPGDEFPEEVAGRASRGGR